jgi:hypothetical protein
MTGIGPGRAHFVALRLATCLVLGPELLMYLKAFGGIGLLCASLGMSFRGTSAILTSSELHAATSPTNEERTIRKALPSKCAFVTIPRCDLVPDLSACGPTASPRPGRTVPRASTDRRPPGEMATRPRDRGA